MNWVVTVVSLLPVLLVGVMFYALPWLTRPTIPLGVSVPSTRIDDPAVVTAIRRYRVGIVVVTVVSLAVGVLSATLSPVGRALLPILVVLVGTLAVYLITRRGIQRAKRDGAWYRDVPVRLTATITTDRRHLPGPAIGWYLAGVVVLMATIVIGAAAYDHLPDPLPVHWNADGVADRFAAKGIWSVFGPVILGLVMVAFFFVLAALMRRWPIRSAASDSPEASARIAHEQTRLLQGLLGQISFAIALTFSLIAVVSWLTPGTPAIILFTVLLPLVLIVVVLLVFVVRYRRAMAAARSGATPSDSPVREAPDDDRFWKAGSIYVNRSDPAFIVPKRFGVGWTVNLGHPAGIIVGVVILVLLVGGIVIGVAAGSHHAAL